MIQVKLMRGLSYSVPENRPELEELVGKTVRLVQCNDRYERTYFGLVDNNHEFLQQWKSFNEYTGRMYKTKRIHALFIPQKDLRFSSEGIIIPKNLTKFYGPEDEGYNPRLDFLKKNNVWHEIPMEVTN